MIDKLPNELNDIIFNMYWKDIYTSHVLKELNKPKELYDKIMLFSKNYGFPTKPYPDHLRYYLYNFDKEIENIISNKPYLLYCKNTYYNIFNIMSESNIKDSHAYYHVNKQYIHICQFLTSKSGNMRFYVYHYFTTVDDYKL